MLANPRSPPSPQFLSHSSPAQSAVGVRRLIPHALLGLPQPEGRLALGKGDPHSLPDRLRFIVRERENKDSMRWSIGCRAPL